MTLQTIQSLDCYWHHWYKAVTYIVTGLYPTDWSPIHVITLDNSARKTSSLTLLNPSSIFRVDCFSGVVDKGAGWALRYKSSNPWVACLNPLRIQKVRWFLWRTIQRIQCNVHNSIMIFVCDLDLNVPKFIINCIFDFDINYRKTFEALHLCWLWSVLSISGIICDIHYTHFQFQGQRYFQILFRYIKTIGFGSALSTLMTLTFILK